MDFTHIYISQGSAATQLPSLSLNSKDLTPLGFHTDQQWYHSGYYSLRSIDQRCTKITNLSLKTVINNNQAE